MHRESEYEFFKTFRTAPFAMAISTIKEGRLLEVNEAFECFFGYRPDDVIGRTAMEIRLWHAPRERQEMVALMEREGEVRELEVTLRDITGEFHSALFSGVVIDHLGEKRLLKLMKKSMVPGL